MAGGAGAPDLPVPDSMSTTTASEALPFAPEPGEIVEWLADNTGGTAEVISVDGEVGNRTFRLRDTMTGSVTNYWEFEVFPLKSQLYHAKQQTYAHIYTVRRRIDEFRKEMERRGRAHDRSKLDEPEATAFMEATHKLAGLTYGTAEYAEALKALGPALGHHYAHNDHHPEHHPDGVGGMDLFQVVEMFCDWAAAVERHDDGDIMASIDKNEARFDLCPQLAGVFRNTARRWRGKPIPGT